jgi:hypothetical protein
MRASTDYLFFTKIFGYYNDTWNGVLYGGVVYLWNDFTNMV